MQTTDRRLNVLLSILLFLPLLAFSFQAGGKPSQDTLGVKKPEPISVDRLVAEMEDLRSLINLNSKKIIPSARLQRIDSLYPIYKGLISNGETQAREFMASNPNQQKINYLIKRWEEYQVQLSGWETEITSYVERNLRLLEIFQSESEVWNLTYERAVENQVPTELLSNVSSAIANLNTIEKQIKDYNFSYLRLQTRINRLRQTVVEIVQALYDKRGSETYDLMYHRHPPIWQLTSGEEPAGQESVVGQESLTDSEMRIAELFQTQRDRLYFLLIFGLGLGLFIRYLKRQLVKTIGPEAASQKSAESYLLFRSPALVIAFILVFTGMLQLLGGARFLEDILILTLLILSILLINYQIPGRFRGLIYSSIFFIAFDSVKTYIWFESLHYRMYMILEALIMAGVLFYFTRPYLKTREQLTSSIGRVMIRLVPLAYLLCAISVISNILGYTNLSDLALKVSTKSGISAIIAYAIFLVFQTVIVSWLEQRFLNSANPDLSQMEFLKKRIIQFLRYGVLFFFLLGFLNVIDELRNVMEFLSSLMNEPYVVGNLTFTLGSIFMFLLILILSYGISRLLAFLISEQYGLMYYFKFPKGIPAAISLVLRYSVLIFGVILALSYLNVDLSEFNLMAGALGLGIGFGLQTVIANFVSGLILIFERPILPGDTIEVNNLLGRVSKIGVRASSISTYDGAEVVVPNMNLISNDLINWTLSDSIKRIEVLVGTTYEADPNQVLDILKECASQFDYVIKEREPVALFTGFGDSSLDFRLLFWVPYEIGLKAKSDVSIAVYNKFKEAGIEIPYPQRDVHIKNLPSGNPPAQGDPA